MPGRLSGRPVTPYRFELAKSFNSLSLVLQSAGELRDAEEALGQAQGLYEKLVAEFPTVPEYRQELARSLNNRGPLLLDTDRRAANAWAGVMSGFTAVWTRSVTSSIDCRTFNSRSGHFTSSERARA